MISRDKSPDVGGFPIRRSTQLLHAVALGLLLGSFVAIAAPAQGKPAASKSKQNTRNTKPTKPALPSTIQAANGESIPVSELIPRTESATQQVEKIVANLDNPEIKQAEASLDVMSKAISGTAEETKKSIRLARSPLQLTEARVAWKRNRAELDVISLAVVGYAADLTQQNQQLLKLRETWTAAAKSAIDAKLPRQFIERVVGVQVVSEQAEKALRDETDRLMKVQMQVAQARTQIDDVFHQLDGAEAALRDQLFAINDPPIWRLFHTSDLRGTWQAITQRLKSAGAQTARFYQAPVKGAPVLPLCHRSNCCGSQVFPQAPDFVAHR